MGLYVWGGMFSSVHAVPAAWFLCSAALCNLKLDPRLPGCFQQPLPKGNAQQVLATRLVPTLGRRGSPRPGMDTTNEADQRQSILDVEKNKAAPGLC